MQFNNPDTLGFIRYQPFSLFYTVNPGVNIQNTTLSSPARNFNIEVTYYRRANNLEYYDTRSLYLSNGFLDPNSTTPGRKVVSVVGNLVTLEKEHGYLPGQPVDAIEGNSMFERSFGFQVLTVPAADQFTYSSTGTLQVGDYVFPEGLTGFPNVPREALMYLVGCTAMNLLYSLGSIDEANQMMVYKEKQAQLLTDMLDPRHDGVPATLVDNRGAFDYT
jgi:hypothetical protein